MAGVSAAAAADSVPTAEAATEDHAEYSARFNNDMHANFKNHWGNQQKPEYLQFINNYQKSSLIKLDITD